MDAPRRNPIGEGERFGNLDVHEVIGRGAFSTVYRATDTLLHRPVALKVVDTATVEDKARAREDILREARMVAKLASPHVITLHRVHELPRDLWAFEMEYLAGGSLLERLDRERTLPPREARRILRAVLSALEVAHARKVIHQDIKPANVLLGDDGSVKLTDFGLGSLITEGEMTAKAEHRARGTPYYMSPEVVMGLAATPASDLWSVGVLLYRMLSGRLPFPAKTLASLFLAIQNSLPVPLGEGASPYLASIALRCLAKSPQDRPASAALLLRELGRQTETTPIPDVRPATAPAPTALIGREAELARFRRWADDAASGHGRTALVLGEPGIGKSALVKEVGQEIRARDFRWIEARLTPLEGLRRPLLQSLRQCLEREAEASGSNGERTPQPSAEILDRLRSAEDSDTRREILESTWEIERMLSSLAREKPLAVLVEDVQVCKHDEIRSLAGLSAALTEARVLLILTWRTKDPDQSDGSDGPPSGYYDLIALPHLERLELAGLTDTAVRTLVEEAAGAPFVSLEVLDRIIQASEGVPLYALALFRHLLAAGEIETVEDAVQPTSRWGQTTPPRFIREMVTRRIERLEPDEGLLLETASVAGTEFDGALLAQLVGKPLLTTLRLLQRLFRDRALIEPLEHGYRFAHALFRDAIYADLAPDLRRALHQAYAEAMASETTLDKRNLETLGWHWEQAGFPERAAGPLREATQGAVRRGELDRAWDLATRSGVFAPDASPEQLREDLDVLLSLGTRLGTAESARSLQDLHARLLEAAEQLADGEMRRRILVAAAWDTYIRCDADAVDEAHLADAAAHVQHAICRFEALWLQANLARNRDDLDAARVLLDRAEATLEPGQRDDLRLTLLHSRGLMLRSEGRLPEALPLFDRAANDLRRSGGDVHAAISRCMALMTRVELGELEAAAAFDEPVRALERGRQRSRAGLAMVFQARLLQAAGETRASDLLLQRAEPILGHGRFRAGLQQLLATRSRSELLRGAVEQARRSVAALRETQDPEEAATDPVTLTRGALLGLIEGEPDEARRDARGALEATRGEASRLALGDVLLSLAELAVLGLDLSDVQSKVAEVLGPNELPPFLALSRDVLRAALHPGQAHLLERGAEAASDPRVGHRQAEVAVFGTLFRARARFLAGATEEGADLLAQARTRARELGHTWLELACLGLGHGAGLPPDDPAARSIERILRERNPAEPDRAASYLNAWLPEGGTR